MDILSSMQKGAELTPAEQQLAQTVLALGDRLQGQSIKDLAGMAAVSIASVHRFCKKLGVSGFKELKVACARASANRSALTEPVDINFPFEAHETAHDIVPRFRSLYQTTIVDTLEVLDLDALDRAARLIANAEHVDIFTHSHNVHPAQMFEERLLSAGKSVSCPLTWEREIRLALGTGPGHAALVISYSGLSAQIARLLPVLQKRKVPVVFIGSPTVRKRHPGLAEYLFVSDRENLQNRITQFASHLAVQFVLDTLYSCIFALDYTENMAFLTDTLPYTMLGGRHPYGFDEHERYDMN